MTPTKRIVVNALATYGQSLVRLLAGFFSIRWVLAALGQSDFGLYCVVGSLITFITFFNSILSVSNARYYAYAIGRGKNIPQDAVQEDLSRWFNTALSIHVVVPAILLLVGYPVGEYAIRHWLNIPDGRLVACVWVFRLASVTAFVSMSSVPFLAMYTAKQYIAVRAGFGLVSTVLNLVFAYCLLHVPGDKLLWYAAYMMVISVGLSFAQVLLALRCFPECRPCLSFWGDWKRIRSLFSYAGWIAFGGGGGSLIGLQGSTLVTNHYFGTVINSSYGIAGALAGHTRMLSNSLMEALSPAVTTREGGGDRAGTLRLADRTGKFGAVLILLFAVPMTLEMKSLLMLWLGRIPDFVVPICCLGLVASVVEKFTFGYQMAIAATGKVALWQLTGGVLNVLIFPAAWLLAALGIGPVSAAIAIALCPCCTFWANLYFAHRILGADVFSYLRHSVLPTMAVTVLSLGAGALSIWVFPMVWWRIGATTFACLAVMLPLSFYFVLSTDERMFLRTKLAGIWRRFLG